MAVRVAEKMPAKFKENYSLRVCEYSYLFGSKSWWEAAVIWNDGPSSRKDAKIKPAKVPFVKGCKKGEVKVRSLMEPVVARMNHELKATGIRPDTGEIVWPDVVRRRARAAAKKAAEHQVA